MGLVSTLFPPMVETNPAPIVSNEGGYLYFELPTFNTSQQHYIEFKITDPYGVNIYTPPDIGRGGPVYNINSTTDRIHTDSITGLIENPIKNQYYKIQLRLFYYYGSYESGLKAFSPWSPTILLRLIDKPQISVTHTFSKIIGYFYFQGTGEEQEQEQFKNYKITINQGTLSHKSKVFSFSPNSNANFTYQIPVELNTNENYTAKIEFETCGGYKGFQQFTHFATQETENKVLTISAKSYPDLGGIMVNFNSKGGENLILDSGNKYSSPDSDKYLVHEYNLSENLEVDTVYTISIKGSLSAGQKWGVWVNGRSKQAQVYSNPECTKSFADSFIPYVTNDVSIGYIKLSSVPEIQSGKSPQIFIFNCPRENAVDGGTIEWIKLEKGAVSLNDIGWSSAPRDGSKKYTLMRSTHKTNFGYWEILGTILIGSESISWLDITAESGVWYKYKAISESTGSVYYSGRSNPILLDLDSIFLSDEDTQFLVALNEDVGGFKYVVTESVTNTLGSKYPFVRRGANTKYRQFNIGGMISFLADEEYNGLDDYEDSISGDDDSYPGPTQSSDGYRGVTIFKEALFLTKQNAFQQAKDLYNEYSKINGYESFEDSIFERAFRDQAMEFLTNGKPKLFRSATEGNILVTLTNVSFTPNKQLGRRIYSFAATATEIDECTIENYKKYNILKETSDLTNPYVLALYGNGVDGDALVLSTESVSEAQQAIVLFQINDPEV